MWRSRKFILITVIATVVLVGSTTGIVLAQTEDENNNPETLLDKVCAIYQQNTGVAIDSEELQKAFTQARDEMREEARDKFLQSLVDEGKITQEQADQYKAWLEAKPDVPLFEPAPFGFPGMHRGFGGPGGFPGWFRPLPPE